MLQRHWERHLLAVAIVINASSFCPARQQKPSPSTQPPPAEREEQEPVRVYTEEVILPVVARDGEGRFHATLEPDDVLVIEDGTPQQVRSVRRVPANVVLLFDMGGQITDTRSMNTTRDIALKIVAGLREGDEVSVIQNSRRVEVLADWTADVDKITRTIRTKLFSSNRSRLSQCLSAAAGKATEKPVGNTHVIIFTDGLETQNDERGYEEAVGRVVSTQATTHVLAYSALARRSVKRKNGNLLDLDFEMKRWRRQYAEATRLNDERLALRCGKWAGVFAARVGGRGRGAGGRSDARHPRTVRRHVHAETPVRR